MNDHPFVSSLPLIQRNKTSLSTDLSLYTGAVVFYRLEKTPMHHELVLTDTGHQQQEH